MATTKDLATTKAVGTSKQPRLLRPGEISCRAQQIISYNDSYSALVLLYKDARVDMDILDETYGNSNWKREFFTLQNNLWCVLSTRESPDADWVPKQDVGVESESEAVKGQASDAFKRAAVNVGIGRELYTAPVIFIKLKPEEVKMGNNGKPKTTSKFALQVSNVTYNEFREIQTLTIIDRSGAVRSQFDRDRAGFKPQAEEQRRNDDEMTSEEEAATPSEKDKLIAEIDAVVRQQTKGMSKDEKSKYGDEKIKPHTNGVLNYKAINDVETLRKLSTSLNQRIA